MGENKESQYVRLLRDLNQMGAFQTTIQTGSEHDPPPPLISKKWLCYRFGLVQPCGRPIYPALYTKVLTPAVIEAMGATVEQVRNRDVKTFTRQQTMVLINVLGL